MAHTKDQIERFFSLAESWSHKATCPRRSVGCLLMYERTIIAGGFNGAPEKLENCITVGCLMEGGHCVRAVHAEIRALAIAARKGYITNGATAIVTLLPCMNCLNALMLAGIEAVYYDESYDRPERDYVHRLAERGSVRLIQRSQV